MPWHVLAVSWALSIRQMRSWDQFVWTTTILEQAKTSLLRCDISYNCRGRLSAMTRRTAVTLAQARKVMVQSEVPSYIESCRKLRTSEAVRLESRQREQIRTCSSSNHTCKESKVPTGCESTSREARMEALWPPSAHAAPVYGFGKRLRKMRFRRRISQVLSLSKDRLV